MKMPTFSLILVLGGCAATPLVISAGQREAFQNVVREAEAEGAGVEPPEAARLLTEAKSEFDYAQRLPRDPDHARAVLNKAQTDAEAALALARHRQQEITAGKVLARREFALPADGH